jgi:SSS family solute:Na+ symporter
VILSFQKLSPLGIPASVWTFLISFAVFFALSFSEKQPET